MDFRLLSEHDVWGYSALDVMEHYGTKVAPTDLTVILGGLMTDGDDRTSEGDLTCWSWCKTQLDFGYVRCVDTRGHHCFISPTLRIISVRPALPPSESSKISLKENGTINGVHVVEYGQYPQTVADARTSNQLEALFNSETLSTTGKNYTFDSVGREYYDTSFKAKSYPEYELNGKRYIRVPGRPANENSKLSNGERVEKGKPYWVEVQPIEWLIDKFGEMVSKKCLFAGIQFHKKERYDCYFEDTSMKHYLDTYFAKEMEPSEREAEYIGIYLSDGKEPECIIKLKEGYEQKVEDVIWCSQLLGQKVESGAPKTTNTMAEEQQTYLGKTFTEMLQQTGKYKYRKWIGELFENLTDVLEVWSGQRLEVKAIRVSQQVYNKYKTREAQLQKGYKKSSGVNHSFILKRMKERIKAANRR